MIRLCAFADEAGSSIDSQIQALKDNGISLIEVRSIDSKSVINFSDAEIARYKKAFFEAGITVWSIGSPIGKVDVSEDFDLYTQKVRRVGEIANMFGTRRVRGFSFYNAYDKKDEVIRRLNTMVEILKEYDVDYCHENEKDIYGDVADRVLDLVEGVKGMKYVYDPANYLQCGEDAAVALKKTLAYTDYFHIKDVDLTDDTLVPAGFGSGDIQGLCRAVENIDTVFTIEPHLAIFDAFSSIDKGEMKNKFVFSSNREAFDYAVQSIKNVLISTGFRETDGGFVK